MLILEILIIALAAAAKIHPSTTIAHRYGTNVANKVRRTINIDDAVHVNEGSDSENLSTTSLLDFNALASFFWSTGGPLSWIVTDGWSSLLDNKKKNTTDPCMYKWYGVTCATVLHGNESTARVVSLVLQSNNLTGHTPPCILNLTALTVLDLRFNALSGDVIPYFFCQMAGLEQLRLNGNSLMGSIPECISNMERFLFESKCFVCSSYSNLHVDSLSILDVSSLDSSGAYDPSQVLSGTFPRSLCNLGSLTKLIAQFSGVSGTIPDCLGIEQPMLAQIGLEGNELEGTIPSSLCMPSLTILFLYTNKLTGKIPNCFGNEQRALLDFSISTNKITGTIPSELCDVNPSFRELDLAENYLSGPIPPCLGNFPSLYYFELGMNRLSGPIPMSVCNLSSVFVLTLGSNRLSGTLPACLGNLLTPAVVMDAKSNSLEGPLPLELCSLGDRLFGLSLSDNLFSGTIPACFGTSFLALEDLFLQNNLLKGSLPSTWNLPNLVNVVLSNNKALSGPIPPSIFHQQGLLMDGSLPIPNLVLEQVILEGTNVDGTIPSDVCSCHVLSSLFLSGNRLAGRLPQCLSSLKRLKTFSAASNSFNGHLPSDFVNWTALASLDLSDNEFSGELPSGLGDLSPQLTSTSLQLNYLSCDLPKSVRYWVRAPGFDSLSLLDGNRFSCGGRSDSYFAVSLSGDAQGLADASPIETDAYSCGGSDYVIPLIAAAVGLFPTAVGIAVMHFHKQLRCTWGCGEKRRLNERRRDLQLAARYFCTVS
jgi:hypothetical protein